MSNELAIQQAPMFGLSTLEEAVNFAGQMAKANLLPAHLKGSPADCLRVVMQAARWQMDPFSVADKTSVISGKLMYEGQLVSAVVNARGNLAKRLDYKFDGEGEKRVLTVTGTLKGEAEPREITLDIVMARKINKNGQINQNPDQQMCYIGARMWARRHTSELMLGVYTPDEIDPDQPDQPENVTPIPDRPAPKERAKRGVAAAKEVVVTQEEQGAVNEVESAMKAREAKLAPVNAEQVQAEMKARGTILEPSKTAKEISQEKVEEKAADVPPPAAAPASRAFLKEGEEAEFLCKIETLTKTFINSGGVRSPGFRVTLSGGFTGEARSIIGATAGKDSENKETIILDPSWVVGKSMAMVLTGKMSAAPAGNPLHGKVLVWLKSFKPVTSTETEEA